MADWSATGAAYARSFARLCAGAVDAVLDEAEARAMGGRLLDVGTGTGTVAAAAAARGWDAAGSDAEPSMLARARELHPGIPFRLGALPELAERTGAFDAVTANFVLNHVPDARVGARELARVAAPDGAVVVTVWHGSASPLRPLWVRVLDAAGVATPPSVTLPVALDFARDPDGVARMLGDAGLGSVRARSVAWIFEIGPADLWAGVEGGIAAVGGVYRAQDRQTRRRMADAFDDLAAEWAPEGLLRVPHSAVVASGRPIG